jgi:adenylate kinase family enzyme
MKLHIFGASGSGVTTLGQTLSKRLVLPYFDSDDYFWERSEPPFTIQRDPAVRNAAIRVDLENQDNWILGGSIYRWGEDVFPRFDLIVFLWVPPAIRMHRIKAREQQRYGDSIITDPQRRKQHEAFLAWAADYDPATGLATRNIHAHEAWLAGREEPVLELRGDHPVEERIEKVLERLAP